MPVLDLAELVNRKVHDELAAMNGQLEQLIAEAVDRELDRLIAAELAGRTNGPAAHREPAEEASGQATKRCRRCQQTKPLGDFQRGRGTCKRCRADQTAAQATTAGPRPFSGWRNVRELAREHPRYVVLPVLSEEARAGRVELVGGRARIVPAAFAPDVLAALAALD